MKKKEEIAKFFTQENKKVSISDNDYVKYYKFNDTETIEATIIQRKFKPKNNWVKISKNQMVNKITGEIKEMKKNVNRGNNISGIKRSQKSILRIVYYNFPEDVTTLHIVLTYSTPNNDWQKGYIDFSYFRSKLKRKYKYLEYL